MSRKHWIDIVKGICMLCVYLLHSEAYYKGDNFSFGSVILPFYVNAFFFVSGYLFFSQMNGGGISALIYRKVQSVIFRLVIPTILFSSLIYFPKTLFHADDCGIGHYFFYVWGGISYWFTSALVVAQLMLLLMASFKIKEIWIYAVITAGLFLLGVSANSHITPGNPSAYFPWFWKTALVYTFVMTLGGIYHKYEKQVEHFMKYGWVVVLLAYLGIVGCGYPIKVIGVGGKCNLAGFVAMCCSILLVVMLAKRIGQCKWLEYVGKNSIVFYFFSGVYPAAVGAVAGRMVPASHYGVTIVVAITSVLLGGITTYVINRFAPFMLDLRFSNDKRKA